MPKAKNLTDHEISLEEINVILGPGEEAEVTDSAARYISEICNPEEVSVEVAEETKKRGRPKKNEE